MKRAVLRIVLLIIMPLFGAVGSISAADKKVWITSETNSDFEVHFEGSLIQLQMVHIKGGTFLMGTPLNERLLRMTTEMDSTQVTVEPFWIGSTEITNGMFRCYDPGHQCGKFRGVSLDGNRQPVVQVTYEEAQCFCEWLSAKTGRNFCLPTEAEWEYACRAGTTSSRYWGNALGEAVKYECLWTLEDFDKERPKGAWALLLKASGNYPHYLAPPLHLEDGHAGSAPVASFKPNPWGLYDMLGNASEICRAAHELSKFSRGREHYIFRGGSWGDIDWAWMRCGSRSMPLRSNERREDMGFRVVCKEEMVDSPIPPDNRKDAHRAGEPDELPNRPSSLIDH